MKLNILRDFIKNPQMYRFLVVGIVTSSIALFFIAILTSALGIFYAYSVLITLEIFTIVNFFIHDKWTFVNTPKSTKSRDRFIKFNLFSLIGFGVNESILIFLTEQIGTYYLISEVIALVITFFFNFGINKKVTWRK